LLAPIDWIIIVSFFVIALAIGLWATGRASKSTSEYFLSGRNMPWLLLGMSMVATTFSIDTPNLVADIVRQNGVAGNWVWWAFLLTGMLTVFVYARLWRRSGVMTDIEFYELRYSGKPAAFLRAFRALYLGLFFNTVVMASVTLAAVKVGTVMLGLTPLQTILIAGGVTVVYSSLGGLLGVLLTDFLLFIIAMIGSIAAAVVAVGHPQIGGLRALLSHPNVADKLSLLPNFDDPELAITIFFVPIAVQWWSVWYPGAEPGGGGYVAQRMLAAKNEQHAMGATLFFNAAHYAARPWPWILVALASLVVFPDLASIKSALPHVEESIIGHDMAYPAMLTFLPTGLLGLALASLIAAYMSTMSTSLNWGASYIVNDFYKRFLRPRASEKELVSAARISTVVMMILASLFALYMEGALNAFNILLQIGAGTGLIFILRWFWWRINALSELTAMVVSFAVAVGFTILRSANNAKIQTLVDSGLTRVDAAQQVGVFRDWQELVLGVAITTICWLVVTFVTRPASRETLLNFYRLIHPSGPGWRDIGQQVRQESPQTQTTAWNIPLGLLCMIIGCIAVYSALFAIGYWIYGSYIVATITTVVAAGSTGFLVKVWAKISGG
jgi:Na+/proline symporter